MILAVNGFLLLFIKQPLRKGVKTNKRNTLIYIGINLKAFYQTLFI